jgi:hypothetical protein
MEETNKHLGDITTLEDWDGEKGPNFNGILTHSLPAI